MDAQVEKVLKELKQIICKAFQDVEYKSQHENISFRQSAYQLAVERIVKAMRLRGHM